MSARRARGRRPGSEKTRSAIVQAARRAFAERGFTGATMRAIALDAGVDAALLHHYFGTKRGLYLEVVEPALTPAGAPPAQTMESSGERIVLAFLERWDQPGGAAALSMLIRTSSGDVNAQAALGELIARTLIAPARASLDERQRMPKLRAALVAAQLVGLAWLRYVACLEPLAQASPALIARSFGASIDATLHAELAAVSPPTPHR